MIFKNSHTIFRFVLLLICVIENSFSFSQNIKFKHISIDEGLSSVTVNTIYQDAQDFIWIGTQDGLNRYDGYHFEIFKNEQNNLKSLAHNDVKCIYEDKRGVMYFGTNGGGLSVYDKYTETFTNYRAGSNANTLSSNTIRDFIELNETELLISTDKGINIFNRQIKKFERIYFNNSNLEIGFTKFFKDSFGNIWLGSETNGLFEYNIKTKSLINHELPKHLLNQVNNTKNKEYQRNNIFSIIQYNKQLICGSDGGLLFFDIEKKQFENVFYFEKEQNKSNNRIKCLVAFSDSNTLMFGTWGGLVKFNLKDFTYSIIQNDEKLINSLSSDNISCILKDNQENLWIGTEDNGVNLYLNSLNKFPLYNSSNGLENDFVYSICQLKNNKILIGTTNGLYNLNPSTNTFSNYNQILKKYNVNDGVLSLLEDDKGNIWIGTYGQGIIVYNPTTKKENRLLSDKNDARTVMKMIQDKQGAIWVATYKDGLYTINPNNFAIKRYTTEQGLPSNDLYCVYENKSDNTILLGTDGEGLCVLNFVSNVDKPHVTVYKHNDYKNSISSNSINSIYKDKQGIFWLATTNGLNKFDIKKKQFTVFSEKDGLPNSYIYDVIPDNDGNLWLPSNSGLSKFNPNIKNEDGTAFKNYNTNDGLQAREFNQGASFRCQDGKILVGGIAGINYFDPKLITDNNKTPSTYFYSLTRQGKTVLTDTSITLKKHLELSYRENYFTCELIAIDYSSSQKTKFIYFLDGYDKQWSSPSSFRSPSYTDLPGGEYIFKVKAANGDGVWNDTPIELKITVIPPWWKTTWFYGLSGFILLASLYGFNTYRMNVIKKENKRLEIKVAQRTKELAEKNRDITSSIEYAKRIQEAILPAKEMIFNKLKNAFIVYKPKDIVSGDFYWFGEKNNYKIIAVVDCTGHGVPGAFMSMIGHNLLNQIAAEENFIDPGLILEKLHEGVQSALKQGQNNVNTNDGMDVSLLALNTETKECLWAGAYRSLVIINHLGNLEKIDGNKYPVGGAQLDAERIFTTHKRQLQENDCLYMFTDGYADQFGGTKGKKFMIKQLHEMLQRTYQYDLSQQHKIIEKQFDDWKGDFEQVDDVLLLGVKI